MALKYVVSEHSYEDAHVHPDKEVKLVAPLGQLHSEHELTQSIQFIIIFWLRLLL